MNIIYGYARVSTERQANDGLSLDMQQEIIDTYRQGLQLKNPALHWGGTYTDPAVSGTEFFTKRPAGSVLDGRLQTCDHLVMVKVDRAFRNIEDATRLASKWFRNGIICHFLDHPGNQKDPHWKAMLWLKTVFAGLEADIIKERVQAAMKHKRASGERYSGRPPIGYRFVSGKDQKGLFCTKMEEDKDGIELAGTCLQMRATEHSYNLIAHFLNHVGWYPDFGRCSYKFGQWNERKVQRYCEYAIQHNIQRARSWTTPMSDWKRNKRTTVGFKKPAKESSCDESQPATIKTSTP